MKKAKIFFAAALVLGRAVTGSTESAAGASSDDLLEIDSTSVFYLNQSIVTAAKAPANAPFAISELGSERISEFSRDVRELPYLFALTPGVVAFGDNGLGTGTTYLRIRGAGDSRINVTLDGVPLNSPEDQCVFWANMNSYASFLGGVQIQRGVGSSTNGDGAFGGTVALSTKTPSLSPSADFQASYGSYNSFKTSLGFNSGLLGRHTVIDGSFSFSRTDGYLHGTAGKGGNWVTGVHLLLSDRLVIRYRNIGNAEYTGQAWNGVVTGNDELSIFEGTYGADTGIRSYADMYRAGLGRFNNLYERLVTDDEGNFVKDADGRYVTERYRMNDGSYWPATDDRFVQDHNILSMAWATGDCWNINASAHYTFGTGYYEEFRYQNKLKKFGLSDIWSPKGGTLSDFVRQKGLTQHTYGITANASYSKGNLGFVAGLNAQNFQGSHFGYITYIGNSVVEESLAGIVALNKPAGLADNKYYDSDAVKTDVSAYAKLSCRFWDCLTAFADLQYRYVRYRTWGINDKFIKAAGGSGKSGPWENHRLDIDKTYSFINPKLGLKFSRDGHNAFASFAMSSREPERNNFTDNGNYAFPEPETLLDYELGYTYTGRSFELGTTLYYMDYDNQFVQTGLVSDIGECLTTNIPSSYRMGIELAGAYTPASWFTLEGNIALSRNRILDFTEVVEDWDNWEGNDYNGGKNVKGEPFDGSGTISYHYDSSTLAFSPAVTGGVSATFRFLRGARAGIHTSFVSRQYLDNTQNLDRSLPAYTFTDINLGYTWEVGRRYLRSVDFGLRLGNIFNGHYAQSGWVYSAIYASGGHDNSGRYTQTGYIPAAGFTAIGSVALHF